MGKLDGKRRKFTPEFKTKVVLEALKEKHTLAELSEKHNVAGTQISTWKSEFINNASSIFGIVKSVQNEEETEKDRLYSKIGQLQMEIDFLKKTLN
jgi:transposase